MVHNQVSFMEEREALTVRFPTRLMAQIRKYKSKEESLNDVVIKALEQEVRYRRGLAAHHRIVARREEIRKKTGIQPDSTDLIRKLREGQGRHD